MSNEKLKDTVLMALDDLKGNDVVCIDVTDQTEITDYMVVVSGTSNRHVKSLVSNVISEASQAGVKPLGLEGMEDGEWVLVDLTDVVVHVMLPAVREFYDIEQLWSFGAKAKGSTP
ncbi:MAG: ribosome silencing factor [Pseudomonadales bacterium]|nr:ribosome silencing factor [Pseudomonadales bacterium]MDG1441712.1 ribosome silencing factor [Pseudomonadales bacterium]